MDTTIIPYSPVAHFDYSNDTTPLDGACVEFDVVQEGSGEASLDNIRPIIPYTGISVVRLGKNFLKYPYADDDEVLTTNGITYTVHEDGSITVDGTATANADLYLFRASSQFQIPNGEYIFSTESTGEQITGFYIYQKVLADNSFTNTPVGGETRVTITQGSWYTCNVRVLSGVTVDNITFYPMIRLATDTDGTFEPYHSDVYQVDFPITTPAIGGAVCCGVADVARGTLTVTGVIVTVSSDSTITKVSATGSGRNYWRIKTSSQIKYTSTNPTWCSHLPKVGISSGNTNVGYATYRTGSSSYTYGFSFRLPLDITPNDTVEEVKAYADEQIAAGTPIRMVAMLETPLEYAIEPTLINALIGKNAVWSPDGDIEVEYLKDGLRRIKLNDNTRTEYFTPRGLKVSYNKILGNNGGTMLSGLKREDVLAWKATVTLTCMPLTPEQQSQILQDVMVENPTLCYFDPLKNGYRTIRYIGNVQEVQHKGRGGTNVEYWTGLVLTAEENCAYSITEQPQDVSEELLNTAYFNVSVEGVGLSYEWQYYIPVSPFWRKITAADYGGLDSPNMSVRVTSARDGYKYRCVITGDNVTLISDWATLTVIETP